jgi:hypothetical protein
MSTTVIKDVTRGLQALLLNQLNPGGTSTAQVSLVPPGETLPKGLGVNLYLYRVIESPSTKNQMWPNDRTAPASRIPALGLELSYLLTPFATVPDATSASGDDAHTILGTAMLTFHENPVLNDVHIPGFDADTVLSPDLLNSVELVKIRLATTSLEELSKIWATINQPYRLSVAYDVSLVMVPPSATPSAAGTVVSATAVSMAASPTPSLDSLTPQSGPLAHEGPGGILVANSLTLAGAGLSMPGQSPVVEFGGQAAAIATSPAPTDTALTIAMPLSVNAGPEADVKARLSSKISAPLTFRIAPWLARLSPVRTALDSGAGPASMVLTLNGQGFTSTPQAVRFDGPGGTIHVATFEGTPADTQLAVGLPPTLANGTYQVRVVLSDGVGSASNARPLTVIPLLLDPIGLTSVSINGNPVHRLTLNGARLNGGDVRVIIDGVAYATGAGANAAQLVITLGRLLSSGSHNVGVMVDGIASHTRVLEVP